jgi:hypothetical protein
MNPMEAPKYELSNVCLLTCTGRTPAQVQTCKLMLPSTLSVTGDRSTTVCLPLSFISIATSTLSRQRDRDGSRALA